jgi:hypothetical protein
MLGGKYIPAAPFTSGGPFNVGAGQGAGAMILMPDGKMLNAGLVGKTWERVLAENKRQVSNYELNLARNPNIVGTGFLSSPGDPVDMLYRKLTGQPYQNTNAAGGNAGISAALAQNQTAYGTPLGQGTGNWPNAVPWGGSQTTPQQTFQPQQFNYQQPSGGAGGGQSFNPWSNMGNNLQTGGNMSGLSNFSGNVQSLQQQPQSLGWPWAFNPTANRPPIYQPFGGSMFYGMM